MAEKELSNVEVIRLIQELKRMEKAEEPKSRRENIFNQIPAEFKTKVCLGCGEDYKDCDCPAGSSERLRSASEITRILMERVDVQNEPEDRSSLEYEIVEPTKGFEMNMAYPQYAENYSQEDIISMATWAQVQQWAHKRLNDKTFGPNNVVHRHMVSILNGFVPYGMRITSRGG